MPLHRCHQGCLLLTSRFVTAEAAPPSKRQKTTIASNDPVPVPVIDDGEEDEEEFDEEDAESALGEEDEEEEGIEVEEWDDELDEPSPKAKVGIDVPDVPVGGKNGTAQPVAVVDDEEED